MRIPFTFCFLAAFVLCACAVYDNKDCQPEHHTVCNEDGTYWADSCGELDELIAECDCGCNADATACEETCGECTRTADCLHLGNNYFCDLNTRRCTCAPHCTGMCCGDDGCGGTCLDNCSAATTCDPRTCECKRNEPCTDGETRCSADLAQRCEDGAWVTIEQCDVGEVCLSGACRPASCSSREDCAGPICLVCKYGQCTTPPPVCQGHQDCCVGYWCNLGTCIAESPCCHSDSDCNDPEFPRCDVASCECVPECIEDIDCLLPGYICNDNQCVTPGCVPEGCLQGEWCDPATGECVGGGCDSNDDCQPPNTCNYDTHVCGQVDCCGGTCTPDQQYCDRLTCQCVHLCSGPDDCPAGFTCDPGSGRCLCTAGGCPPGTTCDQSTGDCMRDGDPCDPTDPNACPAGETCDANQHVCISWGSGGESDPCFTDAECDAGQGLYCDSDTWCHACQIMDPDFDPDFTCRYGCSQLNPDCPADSSCRMRSLAPATRRSAFLCVPD